MFLLSLSLAIFPDSMDVPAMSFPEQTAGRLCSPIFSFFLLQALFKQNLWRGVDHREAVSCAWGSVRRSRHPASQDARCRRRTETSDAAKLLALVAPPSSSWAMSINKWNTNPPALSIPAGKCLFRVQPAVLPSELAAALLYKACGLIMFGQLTN